MLHSQESLGKGVSLTCITTKKFKTSCLSVNLLLPLGQVDPALYAVLFRVLRRGTERYPDRNRLGARLDSLYGVRIEPVLRRRGEVLCVGLLADGMDEAYAGGEALTLEVIRLLGDMLLRPARRDGSFLPEYAAGEQKNWADEIRGKINDKRAYAQSRLYEIMCEGEAYGKNPMGTLERTAAITPQALETAWRTALSRGEIQLFYCGSQPPEKVKEAFLSVLASIKREKILPVSTRVIRRVSRPVRQVTEEIQAVQGKLCIGFRTGTAAGEQSYPAFQLFCCALGGSPSSRLFVHVREKKSLCYYAAAGSDKLKGLMTVDSGIENRNFEIARDEILRQMEEIREGRLTREELEAARRTLIYAFRAAEDSPAALEGYYLTNAAGRLTDSPADTIRRLAGVSPEQVARAAGQVQTDTVYFLKGGVKHG